MPAAANVTTTRRAILAGLFGALPVATTARRAYAGAFDVGDAGWEGGAELFQIAKTELGSDRVKPVATLDWSALRPEDGLLVIHPVDVLDASEATEFMKLGGRVAILDDFGKGDDLLRRFKIDRVTMPGRPLAALRNNPELPIAEPWLDISRGQIGAPHPVVQNVKQLVLNHPTALVHPDLSPVLKVRCAGADDAIVAVAGQVQKGRLFAMSDPSALINSMLRYPGNRAFGAGLVRYLANDGDRGAGRLFVATNEFKQQGSVGGDRTLAKDVEEALRSLADNLADARQQGLPPWMLALLSAVAVALMGLWVARSSGKPYRSPLPRYARPVPLVARGGVAGRFAMLAAPSSPRSLMLLELKSALFEAISAQYDVGPAPSADAVLRAVRRSGSVDAQLYARLEQVVLRMQRAEAAVLAGSGARVGREVVEEAHAVVTAVLAACGALDRGRIQGPVGPVSSSHTPAHPPAAPAPPPGAGAA
jgi:hypothetical protein